MSMMRAMVLILFGTLFFYITHQVTRFAGLPLAANLGIGLFLGLLFACVLAMPLYFWPDRRLQHKAWHDTFFDIAHFALAYINFILVFVVLRDIFAFVAHYALPEMDADSLYGSTATVWMLAGPLLLFALGTLVVRVGPKIKNVELRFANLPPAFENFRIMHITDLHIGQSLPLKFVEKLVRKAQEAPAVDMVVYTGDILDGEASRHEKSLDLLKLTPSKYGNYYISGNHEYYWRGVEAIEAFAKRNFHILHNETETLNVNGDLLQLSGVPDPAARMAQLPGPDLEKLKTTLVPQSFKILLAHQPNIADFATDFGFDLQLSGHTHGGQFFPWNFLIGFFQKYAKGVYKIKNMQLYVNQGTGYWGPSLRLGTYCEMAIITLKKSN